MYFVYKKHVVELGVGFLGLQQPGDTTDHLKKGMQIFSTL
jgi:hypothetical protein